MQNENKSHSKYNFNYLNGKQIKYLLNESMQVNTIQNVNQTLPPHKGQVGYENYRNNKICNNENNNKHENQQTYQNNIKKRIVMTQENNLNTIDFTTQRQQHLQIEQQQMEQQLMKQLMQQQRQQQLMQQQRMQQQMQQLLQQQIQKQKLKQQQLQQQQLQQQQMQQQKSHQQQSHQQQMQQQHVNLTLPQDKGQVDYENSRYNKICNNEKKNKPENQQTYQNNIMTQENNLNAIDFASKAITNRTNIFGFEQNGKADLMLWLSNTGILFQISTLFLIGGILKFFPKELYTIQINNLALIIILYFYYHKNLKL